MNTVDKCAIPFLKWAGGKRWILKSNTELFNLKFNKYIEPFLGSGAVFFHLKPIVSVVSDINEDLINTYIALRDDWPLVYLLLEQHGKNHSIDHYYSIRDITVDCRFAKAANFIYLNRTCWNGLYRVNRKGKFNVPIGTKTKVILDSDDFFSISSILKNAEILNIDFEAVIDRADEGDLIFADPPYTVKHDNNGFLKYNEKLFTWADQVRLKDALLRAVGRGAKFILTNANHESINELYDFDCKKIIIERSSVLSGKSEFRGRVNELIVMG